ncbi:MAG: hypothetical protein B0W54_09935 [Cellvibrio sp. 79]|nr:MAG: hypothetical protein B0W54_09935 [Cellvibrio sp. 79]
MIQTINLAPDYYLNNFSFLVAWVQERYQDLLNDDEQAFLQRFNGLEHDAQCLLVRLSSRKGPLFRRDKLDYAEIPNLDFSAQQLIETGLLQRDVPVSLETLANALTKPELLTLFCTPLAGLKQARKEILIQQLHTQCIGPQSWQSWTNNQFGDAYYLDNQAIIRTLLLLFFGNAYQDLTEFVLQDLGLFRYENYPIDHQHRVFKNREELDQYQQLIQLREQLELDSSIEALVQITTQLPATSTNEKLQRRRAKLVNHIAYELERAGEHLLAQQLYEQSHLSPARERRIRLLEKQEDFSAAWILLNELIEKPRDEQELQIAHRMAPRLAKKLGISFPKKTSAIIHEQHLVLPPLVDEKGMALRVEEVVRLSLDSDIAPCVYAENALIGGLFGLWLWPEMFRGIEGAFANPFQAAPLDLYQENFITNRPGINELRALLGTDQYQAHIIHHWETKSGIANHFVNWTFLSKEILELALQCIPATHLTAIFERLLFDIKNNRSGFPDLIQFFPEQKSYRMIEVKGPGDRIQDNQARWLDYFSRHDIPAEVCYVRWS